MKNIRTRVCLHKNYLTDTLIQLDRECNRLRLNLTQQNKEETVKKLIFKTLLQKKYLRRLNLVKL